MNRSWRLALGVLVASMPARVVAAQCADGSRPPCTSPHKPAAERPVDANRVAIVPFRVTTSDTLLGEGFAELLASEFNGTNTPRAVDMGTMIQAWHRAGGGSRNPLNRAQSLQLARSLGAGIVSEGSIVGLGRSVTITASLLHVPDGAPRGTPARVTTSADSLDYALRRVAAILTATANAPGTTKISDDARYTNSSEALRAYLEGMAHWRAGRLPAAARSFTVAIQRDSMFARAMYRCLIASSWSVTCRVDGRRLFNMRDRLTDAERLVFVGITGANPDAPRTIERAFADVERAVIQLPDNAEALYEAGDIWFHMGSAIDPVGHLRRAVEYFSRAAAIDSQATYLQHLVEAAHRLGDTALIRTTAAAFEHTDSRQRWQVAWLTAARFGDEAALATLRTTSPDTTLTQDVAFDIAVDAPAKLRDEMYVRWRRVLRDSLRPALDYSHGLALLIEGRTAAAETAWAVGLTPVRQRVLNRRRIAATVAGLLGLDETKAEKALREETLADSASVTTRRCYLTLLNLRRGVPIPVDTTGFERYAHHCAFAVGVLGIPMDSDAVTERALLRADSTLRNDLWNTFAPLDGDEALLLSEAWEKFGNHARALAAIRYRETGFPGAEAPWNYAEEGRLAAVVGDTTGAKRAYTLWLQLMRDAEPVYDAKRAEVRAALAKLERAPAP